MWAGRARARGMWAGRRRRVSGGGGSEYPRGGRPRGKSLELPRHLECEMARDVAATNATRPRGVAGRSIARMRTAPEGGSSEVHRHACEPDAVVGPVTGWQPWMEEINAKPNHNIGIPPSKEMGHAPCRNDRRLKKQPAWFAFIFYISRGSRRSCQSGSSRPLNGEIPTL